MNPTFHHDETKGNVYSSFEKSTMEQLKLVIRDALHDLGILLPPQLFAGLSQSCSANMDVICFLQRLCTELSPQTEGPTIVTLQDAIAFAHDLGFDSVVEDNKSDVAIAELIYFLVIELQRQQLAHHYSTSSIPGKDESHTNMSMMEPLRITTENLNNDDSETPLGLQDRQVLESVKESLKANFENRAKLIAARLKVTAQSFFEAETAEQPLPEAQAKLNNLIRSIMNDENSLLPISIDDFIVPDLNKTQNDAEKNANDTLEAVEKLSETKQTREGQEKKSERPE